MDRFLMKISMGSLSVEEERQMVDRYITARPLERIEPVCVLDEVVKLQEDCREVYVHGDLRDYMVGLVQGTRKYGAAPGGGRSMAEGVSPRGTLALLRASQGYAMVQGRDFVVPEDIKAVAVQVLAHRMVTDSGFAEQKIAMVHGLLDSVALPTEDWARP